MRWMSIATFGTTAVVGIAGVGGLARASSPELEPAVAQAIRQVAAVPPAARFPGMGVKSSRRCGAYVQPGAKRRVKVCRSNRYDLEYSLYRGSALMWMKDTLNVRGRKVRGRWRITGSSLWQDAGAIIPNFAEPRGATRIVKTRKRHVWRSSYAYGGRLPTPWGGVEMYRRTASSRWDVFADGRAIGRWTE